MKLGPLWTLNSDKMVLLCFRGPTGLDQLTQETVVRVKVVLVVPPLEVALQHSKPVLGGTASIEEERGAVGLTPISQ
jgi:hypothetical protein